MTTAAVVIQDLTITERQLGLGVTVTYKCDGTAGAETAEVVQTGTAHLIVVHIQQGSTTAAQIKTAIDANPDAAVLVSVAVTGTGSNIQRSCVEVALTGGAAAVAASKLIGSIRYTAKATGTSGNSIRVRYVQNASLSVGVSTNDITVNFDSGVTTAGAIMAAIRASSAANALVAVVGVGFDEPQRVSFAGSFTNLAGGAAIASALKAVKDLTFTAATAGTAGNAVRITYTTGAVAGAEVVSVASSTISIQIENGVSTATDIKAAFDAESAATALAACAITGTGSNVQKTVNALATSGAVAVGPATGFFKNQAVAALTGSFFLIEFGFVADKLILSNDDASGSNTVILSFDGTHTHGVLKANESLSLDSANRGSVYLKYGTAAPDYRVMAYSNAK